MRETSNTALVPYTVEQMFALVADFERYPEFIPWVTATQLAEREPGIFEARLEMHRGIVRDTLATRAVLTRPREITLELIDGPFSTFDGRWTFAPIGDTGSKVGFHLRFEFANPVLDMVLAGTFSNSCRELVDAFVARARSLHGPAR